MNAEKSIARIKKLSVILGIAASIAAFIAFPYDIGLGTALGSLVGVLNFYWLEQVLSGVLSKETSRKKLVYLMKYQGLSFDEAFGLVKEQRPQINLNAQQREAVMNYFAKEAPITPIFMVRESIRKTLPLPLAKH